jgi:hypothetical protein
VIGRCSDGTLSAESPLETFQSEWEQTPGSKNLRQMGKNTLRSDPVEGKTSHIS